MSNILTEVLLTAKEQLDKDLNKATVEIPLALLELERVDAETKKLIENAGAASKEDVNIINAQLDENTNKFNVKNEATLGNDLIIPTWVLGRNWTGNATDGFTHITGSTEILENNLNAIANKVYQIELTVEDTDLMNSGFKFTCSIGDSEPFQMYQGVGSPITYKKGIQAINNGGLKIIPTTDFTGTIKSISVKEVIGSIESNLNISDVFEVRPTKKEFNNTFVGVNAGRYNVSGYENVCIGNSVMENSVSGFWNSALGYKALQNNINGSRNIALGFNSLNSNISGHRNIGIGTFALTRLTTGAYNIGIGADSAWHTTSGSYNIAIGTVSLDNNTTGNQNIAIGYNALRDVTTQSNNVAIGHWALRENTSHSNTAIGSLTLTKNTIGTGHTAIGYKALYILASGNSNTAIGENTLFSLERGSGNTAIGRSSTASLKDGYYNTIIGNESAKNFISGRDNTIIGQGNAISLVNGDGNILIGRNLDVPNSDTSDYLNIGKLIYGDLINRKIGIGIAEPLARVHIGAGTDLVPPMRINGGALLKRTMSGAIENDGNFLYFTNSAGTRLKIQAIPA